MPPPALPVNNTNRLFVDYSYQDKTHTFYWRYSDPDNRDFVIDAISGFLGTITSLLDNTWAIVGARYQNRDTEFSLPTTPPSIGTGTGGTVNAYRKPRQLFWGSRGQFDGRQGGFYLYGINTADSGDFRYQYGEIPALDDSHDFLDELLPGLITTIQNGPTIWRPYTNVQWNSYGERKARGA